MQVCVCVRACVCVHVCAERERERDSERQGEKEREKKREGEGLRSGNVCGWGGVAGERERDRNQLLYDGAVRVRQAAQYHGVEFRV